MLLIDIKARVFGPKDKAFRVFPGHNYRHYQAMRDHSLVFLDFPGMPYPSADGYRKDQATLADIVKAERRSSISLARYSEAGEQLVEIEKIDESSLRWSRRREQMLLWWNNLYKTAQIGDLVIVPSPQRYGGDEAKLVTKVGEIVGAPERWSKGAPEFYDQVGMLARRVKWLADVEEHDLDHKTLRALRTQNPLVLLPAEQLRPVLGAAYKNVVLNDDFLARFLTSGKDVTRESYHFQAFVLAAIEAYNRHINGDYRPLDRSIYAVAADVKRGDPSIPKQDVSIHSPGYTTFRSAHPVVFVIASLFSAALADPAQAFDANGNPSIAVENSESKSYDPCAPKGLEADVIGTFRNIQYDRWQEMCKAATTANEEEGFKPISSVTVVDDDAPR